MATRNAQPPVNEQKTPPPEAGDGLDALLVGPEVSELVFDFDQNVIADVDAAATITLSDRTGVEDDIVVSAARACA